MFARFLPILLLSTPLFAQAGPCLIQQENSVTLQIVVRDKSCFKTGAARDEFGKVLRIALADMAPEQKPVRSKRRLDYRTPSAQRLYDLMELKHQANKMSGQHYYGQK